MPAKAKKLCFVLMPFKETLKETIGMKTAANCAISMKASNATTRN